MIVATDVKSMSRTVRGPVEGHAEQCIRTAAGGVDGVDNLAQASAPGLGEILEIPAPYGVIRCDCRDRRRLLRPAGARF
jgi:hypothetical protein